MDPTHERPEFLDLSQLSEEERERIHRVLFSSECNLKLPWGTEKSVDEGVELEGSEEAGEADTEAAHAAGEEWVSQQYEEQGMAPDGVMGQVQPPPRGAAYTPGPYMIYTMPCMPPPYSPQHYAYTTEVDTQTPRTVYHQRPGKKGDKKMEQPQPYGQPMQYLVSYPTMPYGPATPFFHPMPCYPDYHPAYMPSPEQAVYPEEAPYTPVPAVDIPPLEIKQENHTQIPVTEFQTHEHMCYHAEVTVKAPKRKPPEEVVAVVAAPEAVMPVAEPLPPHPAPPLVIPAPVPVPAVPPVPVVAPVPHTVRAIPERTLDPEELKPHVVEYANAVRGDVAPDFAAVPSPADFSEVSGPAYTDQKLSHTVNGPACADSKLPRAEFPEGAYADNKAPLARTDYPELPPSAPGPANAASSGPQGTKSWAGLFCPSAADKPRPLARVPPFESVASSQGAAPGPLCVNSPSAPFAESHSDFKLADDPYTVRLGESLRQHKLDHRAVSITPRGLTNRSNWCYVNAILQALIACPPFYNLLKALPVPQGAKQAARTPIIGAMVELAQCFPPLTTPVRTKHRDKHGRDESSELPTGSSFEPSGVYTVLDKVRGDSSFTVEGRQEDAEEFLSCLLNGLNDEMFEVLKLMGGGEPELPNGDAGPEPESAEGWKVVMGPKNKGAVTRRAVCGKTPVSDIFRGQLRSRVQRAGSEHTDNVQPFFTLQLDVEKAGSVKEALELLVGKDPLEGMTCSKTHQEIEAWTQTTLEDLPLVLILHLKCFDYKQDGCSKITKTVDFPVDLKVEPKLMSVNKNKYHVKQRNYKLVAVVYHDGKEATKGHYVTDAYHVGLACWIRYDDGNVRKVQEGQVLKPLSPRVPYLLYYRRTDTMSHAKP